jgi:hypothetical protein
MMLMTEDVLLGSVAINCAHLLFQQMLLLLLLAAAAAAPNSTASNALLRKLMPFDGWMVALTDCLQYSW